MWFQVEGAGHVVNDAHGQGGSLPQTAACQSSRIRPAFAGSERGPRDLFRIAPPWCRTCSSSMDTCLIECSNEYFAFKQPVNLQIEGSVDSD